MPILLGIQVYAVKTAQELGDITLAAGETLFLPLSPLFAGQEVDIQVRSEVSQAAFLLSNEVILVQTLPTSLTFAVNEGVREAFVLHNATYVSLWGITAAGVQKQQEFFTVQPIAGLVYGLDYLGFFVLYWAHSGQGTEFYLLCGPKAEAVQVTGLSLTSHQLLAKVLLWPGRTLVLLVQENRQMRMMTYSFDLNAAKAELVETDWECEAGEEVVDMAGEDRLLLLTNRAVYSAIPGITHAFERLMLLLERFDAIKCVDFICTLSNARSFLYISSKALYSLSSSHESLIFLATDKFLSHFYGISINQREETSIVVADYMLTGVSRLARVPGSPALQYAVYMDDEKGLLVAVSDGELRVYSFATQQEMVAVKGLNYQYSVEICGVNTRDQTDIACQRATIVPLPTIFLSNPLFRSNYLLTSSLPSPHFSLTSMNNPVVFDLSSLFSGSNLAYSIATIAASPELEISARFTDRLFAQSSVFELQGDEHLEYSCFSYEKNEVYLGLGKVYGAINANDILIMRRYALDFAQTNGCVFIENSVFRYFIGEDYALFYFMEVISQPIRLPYKPAAVKANSHTIFALARYALHCYSIRTGNRTTIKSSSNQEILSLAVTNSKSALLTMGQVDIFTEIASNYILTCTIPVSNDTSHISLSPTHLITFNGFLQFYSISPCIPDILLKSVHLIDPCRYQSMSIIANDLYLNCGSYVQVVDITAPWHASLVERLEVNWSIMFTGRGIVLLEQLEDLAAVNVTSIARRTNGKEMEIHMNSRPFRGSVAANITVIAQNQANSIAATVSLDVQNRGKYASINETWSSKTEIEAYASIELPIREIFSGSNLHYYVSTTSPKVTSSTFSGFEKVCSLPCSASFLHFNAITQTLICLHDGQIVFSVLRLEAAACVSELTVAISYSGFGAVNVERAEVVGRQERTVVAVMEGMWEVEGNWAQRTGAIVQVDLDTKKHKRHLLDEYFNGYIITHRSEITIQILIYGQSAKLYEVSWKDPYVVPSATLYAAQPGVDIVSASLIPNGSTVPAIYLLTSASHVQLYRLSTPPVLLSNLTLPIDTSSLSLNFLIDNRLFVFSKTHLLVLALPTLAEEQVPLPCSPKKCLPGINFLTLLCSDSTNLIYAMDTVPGRYEVIWTWEMGKASHQTDAYIAVKLANTRLQELFELKNPMIVVEKPSDAMAVELLLQAWNSHNQVEIRVIVRFYGTQWIAWTVAIAIGVLGTLCLCKRRDRGRASDIEMVTLV